MDEERIKQMIIIGEGVKSEFELGLENEGYKFLTNFHKRDEEVYRQAAKEFGFECRFEWNTFDYKGNPTDVDNKFFRSCYILKDVDVPFEFWTRLKEIRNENKKI